MYRCAHVAKKVAVPMTLRDGVIKINSEATHAASEQRNNTLRSRALKWSSHPGSFLPALGAGAAFTGDGDPSPLEESGGASGWTSR